jgi:hypothetical protein
MAIFKEISVVELTEDVCQDGVVVPRGTHGTVIVAGRSTPETYLVEIVGENGATLAEIEVLANQIRPYLPEGAVRPS